MTTLKIKSNPYEKKIEYQSYNEKSSEWEDIKISNPDSKLRNDESAKSFLPFKIKEIMDIIEEEYVVGDEQVEIVFEGTQEEYLELVKICSLEEFANKFKLIRSKVILENAKIILSDTKDIFKVVQPIIEKTVRGDDEVTRDLNKITDAMNNIIPICVFGNYSAGKSTFINALIGREVMPSGGDPVTAKIYKISMSDITDTSRIRFKHWDNPIELLFEGTSFRILKGDTSDVMLKELRELVSDNTKDNMYTLVNKALEFINAYERIDMDSIEIGEVIEVDIPFAKEGILGRSRNNFVVFDTPGSNSNSNTDHSKVLAEALQGFSNGIPVWVSQYESIDSKDNAKLCDDVLNIQALDKRFTMIIMNKADCSDLPENGFSEKQIKNILGYNSVEKMYASGIYFVSSIMGLGAKNGGALNDKYYRKTYRSQQEMFADPEDVDYSRLYIYNIMPEQIKREVVAYSEACSQTEEDLIYANSGLYCIEQEMEDFASKYSAYNKCQMVYLFLNKVVHTANAIIEEKTSFLKRTREKRTEELDEAKNELLGTLNETSESKREEFYKQSKNFVKTYVANSLDYSYNPEELALLDEEVAKQNEEESSFASQERKLSDSKSAMWSHIKENSQSLLKGNIKESLKEMKDNLVNDYKKIQVDKEEMDSSRSEIDKATSDRIMEIVIEKYRQNLQDAEEKVSAVTKQHWLDNAETLKNILVAIITGSNALSGKQREQLSEMIVKHQQLEIDSEANSVFVKARYLKGQFFGFRLNDNERLNTKRLANKFNDIIDKNIKLMAEDLNENCYMAFKTWLARLCSVIEENITELNPQLKQIAELIREETDKINELLEDQRTICSSLVTIRQLMDEKHID